jgi:hypothetical protein
MTDLLENIADEADDSLWDINYLLSIAEQAQKSGELDQAFKLAQSGSKLAATQGLETYCEEFNALIKKIKKQQENGNNFSKGSQNRDQYRENIPLKKHKEKSSKNEFGLDDNSFLKPLIKNLLHINGVKDDDEVPKKQTNLTTNKAISIKRQANNDIKKKISPKISSNDSEKKNNKNSYKKGKKSLKTSQRASSTSKTKKAFQKDSKSSKQKKPSNLFKETHSANSILQEQEHHKTNIPSRTVNSTKKNNEESLSNQLEITISSPRQEEIRKFMDIFRTHDYFLIQTLHHLQGIDFLALKTLQISEHKYAILLTPVKYCRNSTDNVVVEEDHVRFANYMHKNNKNSEPLGNNSKEVQNNTLLKKDLESLKNSQGYIIADITTKSKLFNVIMRYLKEDLIMETFQNNQCVYFHKGLKEYKVFVAPIYVSCLRIGFLEKVLPFAYQRSSNIHFISEEKLPRFLSFLERKYESLTEYAEEENTIHRQSEQFNIYLDRIQKISIPFIPLSALLLFLALFYAGQSFMILLGSSIFSLVLYGIILAYFTFTYYSNITKIRKALLNPTDMNILPPLLDETDLELIAQYFTEQEMEQFIYECFGKNNSFEAIEFNHNETDHEHLDSQEVSIEYRDGNISQNNKKIKNRKETEEGEKEENKIDMDPISKYADLLED